MSEERELSPALNQASQDPTPGSSIADLDGQMKGEIVFDTAPALPAGIYQPVAGPIEGDDLVKLRIFFLEKLTVKQLRKLVYTAEGRSDNAERSFAKVVTSEKPPTHAPRLKRRLKINTDPVPGKRAFLLPPDMRFSFCLLCINNFTIETPSVASKEINCVKICSGTRRILYDTNFMLGEDWCSSVISVHFDNIEWISIFKEQLVVNLSRPAIVEASYKNGCPSFLGVANGEIESATHHTVMMRSPHDLAGIKTAILSADPNMVHKFTASKMEHHAQVKEEHQVMYPMPVHRGLAEEYVPQQEHFRVNTKPSALPSHYMVPQVAPTSYGPVNGSNSFTVNASNSFNHQALSFPRQGPDAMLYAGGLFNSTPQLVLKENPYGHSQYAQQIPDIAPMNASEFCIPSLPLNSMHFVDPGFAQMDGGCLPPREEPILEMRMDADAPKKGIIEMAMLGVDEIDACSEEERTINAAHQQWGAGASHLGFFDTPML